MFRIKICGVTRPEDAVAACEAGADCLGLNFYRKSPRWVSIPAAQAIRKACPANVKFTGVFVNMPLEEVRQIAGDVPLDFVQLHGDEPADYIARLAPWPAIRAFRVVAGKLDEVESELEACQRGGVAPAAILLDGYHAGQFGGTGERVDWDALSHWNPQFALPPVILAGGLNPANVAAAIALTRPAAVDAASGVESSPGIKDHALMRQFVAAARQAFAGAL